MSVDYWDRGVEFVPVVTGAAHLLDCRDLRLVFDKLSVCLPVRALLDVGCGTGRAAQLAEFYRGVDVSRSAVLYCRERGLDVAPIVGPHDLPVDRFDLVLCASVFTHVDRETRRAYLEVFRTLAPVTVVDVIPGDGRGDVGCWSADLDEFTEDYTQAGFQLAAQYEASWDAYTHRYFRLDGAPL